MSDFLKNNKAWLDKTIRFPAQRSKDKRSVLSSPVKKRLKTSAVSGNRKNFCELSSDRSKYRRTEFLRSSSSSPDEMCFAAKVLYHQEGDHNSASILESFLKNNDLSGSNNYAKKSVLPKVTPLRAVLMLLSTNLTKSDYQHIKKGISRPIAWLRCYSQGKKRMCTFRYASFT